MRKAGLPRRLSNTSRQPSGRTQRALPTPISSLLLHVHFLGKSQGTGRELHTVTLGLGFILCPKTSSQTSFFLALSFCFNKDILNK